MTLIKGLTETDSSDMADKMADAIAGDTAELVFAPVQPDQEDARIKVIGVGGGGGNATQRMDSGMSEHVEIICVNTDAQVLRDLKVGHPVQIGRETTSGLGAGADPEIGRQAALESKDTLSGLVENTDMLFITAGMGGGTGTGAAPVIAELAREAGVLTVAVVTRPFTFEGNLRGNLAEQGIRELSVYVDSIITIPNDRLISELGDDISMEDAFVEADKVLHGAVCGISDLILRPGTINVDFADVRTVMKQKGLAMMGTGIAEGEHRAIEATQQAVNCRLLDEVNITNARAMLVNVTTTRQGLGLSEFNLIAEELKPLLDRGAQVVMGTTHDEYMGDKLKVTLVVAGFGSEEKERVDAVPTAESGNLRQITSPRSVRGEVGSGLEELEEERVAVVSPVYLAEGNLAPKPELAPAPKNPDWTKGEERQKFDIPAYLRKQHD